MRRALQPRDLVAPVRLVDVDIRSQQALDPGEIAAPCFVVIWDGDHVVDTIRRFLPSAPPLSKQMAGYATDGQRRANQEPTNAGVSLVICTRDRPKMLESCLASLSSQLRKPDELIVVDNGSVDEQTRQIATSFGATYVREDRPGLSHARNAGVLAARCDIIAFTDDDVLLHDRWLAALVAAFDDKQVWAVTGLVLPAALDTPAQIVFERAWGFGRGFGREDFGRSFYLATRDRGCPVWEIGAGANMAVRREAFDQIGYYDTRLGAGASGCSEDSELWYRVLHAGKICRYEPDAIVRHHHRRDDDGLRTQIRAYIRGHVAALAIQYWRTGDVGNLRRMLWSMPGRYLRQLFRRLRFGQTVSTCLLRDELIGYVQGLGYALWIFWSGSRASISR